MKKILYMIVSVMLVISISSCSFVGKLTNKVDTDETQNVVTDNSITVGLYDVDTFNPLITNSETVINLSGFLFEPLFSVNSDGTTDGVLADSYSVSSDGKSIIVNLKRNVKWHDGSNFDGADVQYTYNKIKEGNSGYNRLTENISELVLIDYYTLKFSFYSSVPNAVALLSFPIIKNNSADTDTFKPIGTGPYRFNNENLIPYEEYHGTAPNIAEIKIKRVPDKDKFVSLLNASVFDVADSFVLDMNSYTPKTNAQVHAYLSNKMVFAGFNCNSSVFRHKEARRAVSSLLDRKNYASNYYFSRAEATAYPVNPDFYFYPEAEVNLYKDTLTAEEELTSNGWELNSNDIYMLLDKSSVVYFTVNIIVNKNDEARLKIAEELSGLMNGIGMYNSLIRCTETELNSRITNGNYDIFIGETELLPNGDLTELLVSDSNVFNYSNEECEAVISQLGTLTETDDIKAVWGNLCDILTEDVPIAPICFIKESLITGSRLKSGVEPSVTGTVRKTENWSLQ